MNILGREIPRDAFLTRFSPIVNYFALFYTSRTRNIPLNYKARARVFPPAKSVFATNELFRAV